MKNLCHWCGKTIDPNSTFPPACNEECMWYLKKHLQFKEKNRVKFHTLLLFFLILALTSIITYHLRWAVLIVLLCLGLTFIFLPFTSQKLISIIGAKKTIYLTRLIGTAMFLLGIATLYFGWFNQVVIQKDETKLMHYSFYYLDSSNIYSALSKQRYSYSDNINYEYISIITLNGFKAKVNEYKVTDGGTLDITVPKDKKFIISFHASRIIVATWNIKSTFDKNIIKLNKCIWTVIPPPYSDRGKTGTDYDRQNFYFSSLKEGTDKLIFGYESSGNFPNRFFETTLIITVK